MSDDLDQLALYFAINGGDWLKPVPADCQALDPLPKRLDGWVFSTWNLLEGAQDEQYRLAPRTEPEANLAETGLHEMWPDGADNDHTRALFAEVQCVLEVAAAIRDPREAMHALIADVCRVLAGGYHVHAQFFDEDDNWVGESDDLAPGLLAAFEARWAPEEVTS